MTPESCWGQTSLYYKTSGTKCNNYRVFYTGILSGDKEYHTIEEFKFICHNICNFSPHLFGSVFEVTIYYFSFNKWLDCVDATLVKNN
jgi:hypothetical protein